MMMTCNLLLRMQCLSQQVERVRLTSCCSSANDLGQSMSCVRMILYRAYDRPKRIRESWPNQCWMWTSFEIHTCRLQLRTQDSRFKIQEWQIHVFRRATKIKAPWHSSEPHLIPEIDAFPLKGRHLQALLCHPWRTWFAKQILRGSSMHWFSWAKQISKKVLHNDFNIVEMQSTTAVWYCMVRFICIHVTVLSQCQPLTIRVAACHDATATIWV